MTEKRKSPGHGASPKAQNRPSSTCQLYRNNINASDLKSQINTASFYTRETGRLVRSDAGWQSAICPLHEDSTPSLRVLIPDGAFKCHGCGARGGDVISFTMQKHEVSFPSAVEYLQREYGGGS